MTVFIDGSFVHSYKCNNMFFVLSKGVFGTYENNKYQDNQSSEAEQINTGLGKL